jgi:protocatechuate 3,4-dioxygenase beta subunit
VKPSTVAGDRLVLSGVVLDRECRPMPGTTVRVWNADPSGNYGPSDQTNLVCCYLDGTTTTDERGRFAAMTLKPGGYQLGPGHIHVQVGVPMVASGSQEFEVEFEGDAGLSYDPGTVLVPLEKATDQHGIVWAAFAAFVYARS